MSSDWHLSPRPPVFRSVEEDWRRAMERACVQVAELCLEHKCPLILAGDVFHKWNVPPETINFAIEMFNLFRHGVYAVPGQHDLPHHRYQDMDRSAYGTLVAAGKIAELLPGFHTTLPGMVLHGFPWGYDPEPWEGGSVSPFGIRVAVVHKYVWDAAHCYPNAPRSSYIGPVRRSLQGYDVVVVGDNHKGFSWKAKEGRPALFNCGTLMRRNADEKDYRPGVGLLRADGTVKRHYLDVSRDETLAKTLALGDMRQHGDLAEFVEELQFLESSSVDFVAAVKQYLDSKSLPDGVRAAVLEALEGEDK